MDTQYYLIAEDLANEPVQAISVKNSGDVLLSGTMPQAEYMYGCAATAIGMLLGYYDLYGYTVDGTTYDFSNLIEGTVSVDSRGSDGKSIYDMKDPSLLANFIASTGYIDRFYDQTPEDEKAYSFVDGAPSLGLNISVWDCLADYLGTGQYWRANEDTSTILYQTSLSVLNTTKQTETVDGEKIPIKYIDFKYGLSLYVESRGFELDAEKTQSIAVENFSFDDFVAEIDAGRSVLISMNSASGGHMVLAYGYNLSTREIIFDDTYENDCRMVWDGTYLYGNEFYQISSVSTVVFDVSNLTPETPPEAPEVVWLNNWKEAQALARTLDAPILLYYGNRNTCGYCAYLEDQVFASEEFKNYAASGAIVLLSNATVPGVSPGFSTPMCILLNPDGSVIASRSGYGANTQADWLNWLSGYLKTPEVVQLPDLLVSGVVLASAQGAAVGSTEIKTGDKLFLSFDVSNQGNAAAGKSFNVQILVDEKIVKTLEISTLSAGASQQFSDLELGSLTAGEHTIKIVVDPEKTLSESSVANNTFESTVSVTNSADWRIVSAAESMTDVTSSMLQIVSGGELSVSSGGVVQNSVIDGGLMTVYSGGSASSISVNSGTMFVSSGAIISELNVSSGGSAVLHGGAVLNGKQTFAGNVTLSGTVDGTSATICFDISPASPGNNIIVNNLALLNSNDFHVTVSATQKNGMYKLAAGAANFTGSITICTGNGTCLDPVQTGKSVYDSTTSKWYHLNVSGDILGLEISNSSGTTPQPPVNSNYPVTIYSGGKLVSGGSVCSNSSIGRNNIIYVSSGGRVVDTDITYGGVMYASQEAVISGLNISSGGSAVMYQNTILEGEQNYAGNVYLFGAVNASAANVCFDISSRSAGNLAIVNSLSLLDAASYSVTISATQKQGQYKIAGDAANFTGSITICTTTGTCFEPLRVGYSVYDSATSNWYTLNVSGGVLGLEISDTSPAPHPGPEPTPPVPVPPDSPVKIYSNGQLVSGTTVLSGASISKTQLLYASSGGSVINTAVTSGGVMYVSKDAVVSDLHVNSGGSAVLSAGTILTGSQTYAGKVQLTGKVDASEADVYLDISGRSVFSNAIINDLSALAAGSFHITISATQADGTYILANNAADFQNTITVNVKDTECGTLTVNGTAVEWQGMSLKLQRNAGTLSLSVNRPSYTPVLNGNGDGISFTGIPGSEHTVEFSSDDFSATLEIKTRTGAIDTYGVPTGTYRWQVTDSENGTSFGGNQIFSFNLNTPEEFVSDADGNIDVFFANANGVWAKGFGAKHQGSGSWQGTRESVLLDGRNKISDVFTGSTDANILLLTDSANGDALFIDDIYTKFGRDASRLAQIDEIRAGAGSDIIDLTSQQFAYIGDGITICGGAGDDTIWANSGNNTLFGDAGNDRLVGANGNDIITGGAGNDSMHGGGGDDIFCFGANFGQDTVEQLSDGSVTLHFESGSEANWDADTLTYTDGVNSVTVSGVTEVSLVFGGTAPVEGAFLDAASEKVFEDKTKNMIA